MPGAVLWTSLDQLCWAMTLRVFCVYQSFFLHRSQSSIVGFDFESTWWSSLEVTIPVSHSMSLFFDNVFLMGFGYEFLTSPEIHCGTQTGLRYSLKLAFRASSGRGRRNCSSSVHESVSSFAFLGMVLGELEISAHAFVVITVYHLAAVPRQWTVQTLQTNDCEKTSLMKKKARCTTPTAEIFLLEFSSWNTAELEIRARALDPISLPWFAWNRNASLW